MSLWHGETQLAEPKAAENGQRVTFVLDTVAQGFTPGSYTLTAKYEATGSMGEQTADVTFDVAYLPAEDAPDAEIPGEDGGNAWLDEEPTLTAPENAQISLGCGAEATWSDSISLPDEEGVHTYTYYVKTSDGKIAEKTVTVSIDRTAPEVEEPAVLADPTKAEITIPATDKVSGVADYVIEQMDGAGKVQIADNGDGSFTVSGMTAGETYTFTLTVMDNAGNVATVKFTVTAAQLPSLPETGDNGRFGLWLMLLAAACTGTALLRKKAYR